MAGGVDHGFDRCFRGRIQIALPSGFLALPRARQSERAERWVSLGVRPGARGGKESLLQEPIRLASLPCMGARCKPVRRARSNYKVVVYIESYGG